MQTYLGLKPQVGLHQSVETKHRLLRILKFWSQEIAMWYRELGCCDSKEIVFHRLHLRRQSKLRNLSTTTKHKVLDEVIKVKY